MKKLFTLFIAQLFAITLIPHHSSLSIAPGDTTLPVTDSYYVWQDNDWALDYKISYEYNSKAGITVFLKEIISDGSLIPYLRTINNYDGLNRLIETIPQQYVDGNWLPYTLNEKRRTYSYDEKNRVVEEIEYDYEDGNWIDIMYYRFQYDEDLRRNTSTELSKSESGLENMYRTISEYDADNNEILSISSSWDDENESWDEYMKSTFEYTKTDTGEVKHNVNYRMNDTGWAYTSDYYIIYDLNGNLVYSELATWIDGQWEKKAIVTYNYDEWNRVTEMISQMLVSGNMEYSLKSVWQYDNDLKELNYRQFKYIENNWVAAAASYTDYDENWNPLETIRKDIANSEEKNRNKDVYTYITINSVDNAETSAITVSTNPNPCFGTTTLSFALDEPQNVGISIFDATGKTAMAPFSQYFVAGKCELKLNLQSLPTGVYMIMLKTNKEIKTTKLLILNS